jgi:hypothetical protein
MFDLLSLVAGLAIGAPVGAWFYRYTLKRDPAKLEEWAALARLKGEQLRDKFK